MRFVTDRIHGAIDYVAAAALIVVPLVANFEAISPVAHWLSIIAGAGLLLYSLVTNYTYSATGLISFGFHLALDFAAGLVFLIAPFAFGFGGIPRAFYLAAGAAVVLLVLFTDPAVETGSQDEAETVSDVVPEATVPEEAQTEIEPTSSSDTDQNTGEEDDESRHSTAGA